MPSINDAGNGFIVAKRKLLKALLDGNFLHESRDRISVKNDLLMGRVTTEQLIAIIKRSRGHQHTASTHHSDESITVHIFKTSGWYVKFYFLDPVTVFISVHPEGLS